MSSNKNNKLVISIRDENLLKDSNIIHDHKILIDTMNRQPRVRYKDLNEDELNFFTHVYPKIIKNVIQEWQIIRGSIEYRENSDFACELCGQRPIKNICGIENAFSNKTLKIGTECAEYFGIGDKAEINDLLKESKVLGYLEILNREFPGIERIINEWSHIIDSQNIIMKKSLIERYILIGKQAKELFERFLNPQTTQARRIEIIIELKKKLIEADTELEEIKAYIDVNKDNPMIARKIYLNNIDDYNRNIVQSEFEEKGMLSKLTVWRINNLEFTKFIVDKVAPSLSKIGFRVVQTIEHRGKTGISVHYKGLNNITFFCPHEIVAKTYCGEIFNDDLDDVSENEQKKALIDNCHIIEENSRVSAVWKIFGSLKIKKYEIYEPDEMDYSFDELIVRDTSSNLYYQLVFSRFINEFTKYLFDNQLNVNNELTQYIDKSIKKGYKKEDIDLFIKGRN